MKKTVLFACIAFLAGCAQPEPSNQSLASEVERLTAQVQEMKEKYKPGLGEFMSGIQMHHAKLWFAGINGNWKLAEFEIGEIREDFEQAAAVDTDRPETQDIPMIYPPADSVAVAIQKQQVEAFKSSFRLLTSTCNTCHQKNKFEFNVITLPTGLPVTNQEFKKSR